MVPIATFKITGEIDRFDRMDNLFNALKREGAKLLKNWTIEVDAKYEESQGEEER